VILFQDFIAGNTVVQSDFDFGFIILKNIIVDTLTASHVCNSKYTPFGYLIGPVWLLHLCWPGSGDAVLTFGFLIKRLS
jgi:hypothetical protein